MCKPLRRQIPGKFNQAFQQFLAIIKNNEYAKELAAAGTGSNISFLVSIGDAPLKNWQLSGLDALPNVDQPGWRQHG